MATHVADRILAALKSRMASVPGITGAHLLPLHMLDSSQLPAIVIEQARDTVTRAQADSEAGDVLLTLDTV